MVESEPCALCGTSGWEWEENKRAYEPVENFCMGCYLRTIAADGVGQDPGVSIGLAPTGGPSGAKRLLAQKNRFERSRRNE